MAKSSTLKLPKVFAGVANVYLVQVLVCGPANLILIGLFFYNTQQFGWGIYSNLLLAAGNGVVYVIGALCAGPLSGRRGRRHLLGILEVLLTLLCVMPLVHCAPVVTSIVALLYSGVSAMQWPLIESLASSGAGGELLSRRLTVYNLVWSAANAVTVAAERDGDPALAGGAVCTGGGGACGGAGGASVRQEPNRSRARIPAAARISNRSRSF